MTGLAGRTKARVVQLDFLHAVEFTRFNRDAAQVVSARRQIRLVIGRRWLGSRAAREAVSFLVLGTCDAAAFEWQACPVSGRVQPLGVRTRANSS